MTFVALALVVVLAVTILAFAGIIARQNRAHARREDLLLNQVLHLSGRTWQPPPAAAEYRDDPDQALREWTAAPEQLPVD